MGDYETLLRDALVSIKQLRQQLADAEAARHEPIAIIGIGCRLPGEVACPEDFWKLLSQGVDGVSEIPRDRWDSLDYFDRDPDAPGKICSREGGFLRHKDLFDPQFFRISPREAMFMDPQQRLLLEVAWEALENANLPADRLSGSATGVFVGASTFDYANLVAEHLPETDIDPSVGTGCALSALSGRLSYVFGFHGPSASVDTACSSSLVAVHEACESLRRHECALALAGGVNMMLAPFNHIILSRAHMLAPDGRCKAFDDSADGYVRSEGAALVVLRRLTDALANRDHILGLIRGSAINHSGPSGGLTVPNGPAQREVILSALRNARATPAEISFIEAHGTGTALGDPIELNALGEVYGQSHTSERPLLVGSAKTNVGHLEAAAGVCGLIKVVLQLQHAVISPHLHLRRPSSKVAWNRLPIEVPTTLTPWPGGSGRPRLAGVSSFGFSGTNAHLIVQEAPALPPAATVAGPTRHLLALSAKTENALTQLAKSYVRWCEDGPDADPGDLCYSANAGRSHFACRLAVTGESIAQIQRNLQVPEDGSVQGVYRRKLAKSAQPKVAFLFTGQGAQCVNMGRELYHAQPLFREWINKSDAILKQEHGYSIIDLLYGQTDEMLIAQTGYAQPLLYAIEFALASLWRSWGISPALVMGHSVGEYAAAAIAGVFSMEDGLRLIAARGRLMQGLPEGGGMVSVHASRDQAAEAIAPYSTEIAFAAFNGPSAVVISGGRGRLMEITEALKRRGIAAQPLRVSHAFHSPLMEPMLRPFAEVASQLTYLPPRIDVVSNLTGDRAGDDLSSGDYWVRHAIAPVRFQQGVETLARLGCNLFLEIGPKPTLINMGRRCLQAGVEWLPSLVPGRKDSEVLLDGLARLYVSGLSLDWEAVHRPYPRRKLTLPTYPFQRQRCWFAHGMPSKRAGGPPPGRTHPLLGTRESSPNLDTSEIRFLSHISQAEPAFLEGHRVFGRAVFPAAGYLEIAVAAGWSLLGQPPLLTNFELRRPMSLVRGTQRAIRTVLSCDGPGRYAIQLLSRESDSDPASASWLLHVQAVLEANGQPAPLSTEFPDPDPGRHVETEPGAHYERCRSFGLEYGPAFQSVHRLVSKPGWASGHIQLPEGLRGDASDYLLHPSLMDGALQALCAALGEAEEGFTYLPVGFGSCSVFRRLGPEHEVRASLHPSASGGTSILKADLSVLGPDGSIAVRILDLRLQRATAASMLHALDPDHSHSTYQVHWERKAIPEESATQPGPRHIIIFADSGGIGVQLSRSLQNDGARTTLVFPKETEEAQSEPDSTLFINPALPRHFARVFEEPCDQVLYLWGLELLRRRADPTLYLNTTRLLGCGPFLNLIKSLPPSTGSRINSITVLTRGAFSISRESHVNAEPAALAGLLRVARLEFPSLRWAHLDLSPDFARGKLEEEVHHIARELRASDGELEVALRSGLRHCPRLVRAIPEAAVSGPVRVAVRQAGTIDNLALEPDERTSPSGQEVQVAARAAGVNFKDILHVLGLLKQHGRDEDLGQVSRMSLGFECAGVVVGVGEAVSGVRVGDAVVGYGMDCLRSKVMLQQDTVVRMPANLTFEEAAGVPTAFLTAYHALYTLARIRPSDRVLVHAGAGGVGQAAIQLCKRIGAEVLATASPAKWEFLKSQGIRHVMNSRTLDFKDQIRECTGGRGVDVGLNSLNGEFIPASLELVAPAGRFVEIGKLGAWTAAQVSAARPDVRYFTFDLGEGMEARRKDFNAALSEVLQWMRESAIQPIPVESFPANRVADAFRRLSQAKNIGKVVVTFPTPPPIQRPESPHGRSPIRPDGGYLITGGLGGLGLRVAEWLVDHGARRLILLGRKVPSSKAAAVISNLARQGVQVQVAQADVAVREDLEALLGRASGQMGPLRGIVHAAGVLDDGILREQTWERFESVLAPKAQGAWNLHSLTEHLRLDFFVCFSSISGALGAPGQGSYAAANTYLDALMQHRRSQGLHGLSIGWGPWASVGMAANLAPRHRKELNEKGVRAMPVQACLHALDRLLSLDAPHVVVADIDWVKLVNRTYKSVVPRFLEALASEEHAPVEEEQSQGTTSTLLEQIKRLPPQEHRAFLTGHLSRFLVRTLGFSSTEQIDTSRSFFDLGMDSLSAVELRHLIETSFGCAIPETMLFEFPSLDGVADYLLDHALNGDRDAAGNTTPLESPLNQEVP